MRKQHELLFVTLGTIILGLDYIFNFIPGLPAFFSLNRFIFLGIVLVDILFFSNKYLHSKGIFLACALITIGCLPFLLFDGEQSGGDFFYYGIKLLGIFSYLIFFYSNCTKPECAQRIMSILFLASGIMAIYVMGSQLGLLGKKLERWRGAVEFTSASGIFDPNVIAVYFLPVFAFGPLLWLRRNKNSGYLFNFFIILYLTFCFTAFFQLNSRAGSIAVGTSLGSALLLSILIVPRQQRGLYAHVFLFLILIIGAVIYIQNKYNILDTIIGIYGETDLSTDTSFAARLAAYNYLKNELLSSPNFFGSGYHKYWVTSGWQGYWPHCVFVDVYIKGGILYLFTYLGLLFGAIAVSLRQSFTSENLLQRSYFAGFFCFLVGLLPLAATLSIDGVKLPWAIMGCVMGLTAGKNSLPKQQTTAD